MLIALLLPLSSVVADEGSPESQPEASVFSYGKKGFQYESADANNFLWFGVRLQPRYTGSDANDGTGDFDVSSKESELRRGRLKLGGHLWRPELAVYSEYDFTKSSLLDLRVTYKFADWLSIRAGQWKSEYNRERIDSSGKQTFAERSISTSWFTVDRQKGIMLSGRLSAGNALDSSYWFGRLSGAGRGGDLDNADGLWMGRYQWNFTRRVLEFSQSDLGRRERPAGSVAIAAVSGSSGFTRFSGSGGGQLPGFEDGESDRYDIRQFLFETAWQRGGFSWQQELHWKTITDTTLAEKYELTGGYMQAGMFLSEVWSFIPEPMEFALRYTRNDPDGIDGITREEERLFGVNWFFKGHRSKITADIARSKRMQNGLEVSETRGRLQWDVSF